jgi:hypothetical protein
MSTINLACIEDPIHPEEIYTMDDLLHYQHQRLGSEFQGVPGISIPSFNFSLLDSLLSKAMRVDRQAFQDMIVVPDEEDLFVTTHLEVGDAGQRICNVLTRLAQHPLETEFVVKFRLTTLDQHWNHWQWMANGRRIFQLKLPFQAAS